MGYVAKFAFFLMGAPMLVSFYSVWLFEVGYGLAQCVLSVIFVGVFSTLPWTRPSSWTCRFASPHGHVVRSSSRIALAQLGLYVCTLYTTPDARRKGT